MKLISELTDRHIKEILILNECKKSQQIKFLGSDYFWMVTFSQLLRELKCSPCVFFSSSQMYVHHGIHDLIFNFVGTLEASQVGVTQEALCEGKCVQISVFCLHFSIMEVCFI